MEVTNISELFILGVLKEFNFLTRYGYLTPNVGAFFTEVGINYLSKTRKVSIIMPDPDLIIIEIHNLCFSFKKNVINVNQIIAEKCSEVVIPGVLSEKNLNDVLRKYSIFIQENLLPIIDGTKW